MALGFAVTLGAGATDRVDTAYATHSAQSTWFVWTNRNGGGGGSGFGRVFDKVGAGPTAEYEMLQNTTGPNNYRFRREFSTTDGQWTIAQPSGSVWHGIGISYDSGATTNDPVIYVDGASVTVTEAATPVGTATDDGSANYQIGNHLTLNREWDGLLAEFAKWNRILTADEHAALGKGYSPLWFKRGLVLHLPMLRANVNTYGTTPSVTGTVVQPHPRIIYPKPSGVGIWAPAGALIGSSTITFGSAATLTGSGALAGTSAMAFSAAGTLVDRRRTLLLRPKSAQLAPLLHY